MIPRTSSPTFRSRYHPSGASRYMKTRAIDGAELKGGGYAAQPDGDGPHPGVVVIHEAYGLNENIKEITRRFAENGYAALAGDLFSRRNLAICIARDLTRILIVSADPPA